MMYLPEKARMQEAARIALLEQRLCNLESVIGTTSDKLSKFSQVCSTINSYIIIILIVSHIFSVFLIISK